MNIINSKTDLVNYVNDCCADFVSAGLGDSLADAIQDEDHPAWGDDWESWLSTNIEIIKSEVVEASKTVYQWLIVSAAGVRMGEYMGTTREAALDAMARDAGYRDQQHATTDSSAFDGKVIKIDYRLIVGENGNETGHVIGVDGTAMDAHDMLQREIAGYGGDGWGRIEYTLPTMEGWARLDPQ